MRRQLKSINFTDTEKISAKDIPNIPNFKKLIISESFEAIKAAHDSLQEIAVLFEINNSGYIVQMERNHWVNALEKAVKFYEKSEEFEKCILVNNLITKINEERRNPKNSTGNKRYVKRRNTSKAKKEKRSVPK